MINSFLKPKSCPMKARQRRGSADRARIRLLTWTTPVAVSSCVMLGKYRRFDNEGISTSYSYEAPPTVSASIR